MPVSPSPRRLAALPDLDPYELHAGALDFAHIGRTVVVRTAAATVVGPLAAVTDAAAGQSEVRLRIATDDESGHLTVVVDYALPVTVLPGGHGVTVTIAPSPTTP